MQMFATLFEQLLNKFTFLSLYWIFLIDLFKAYAEKWKRNNQVNLKKQGLPLNTNMQSIGNDLFDFKQWIKWGNWSDIILTGIKFG